YEFLRLATLAAYTARSPSHQRETRAVLFCAFALVSSVRGCRQTASGVGGVTVERIRATPAGEARWRSFAGAHRSSVVVLSSHDGARSVVAGCSSRCR